MNKSKVRAELKTLFFLDVTKFKNYIKDAFHHPGKLIGLIIQYGFQFIWLLPIILFNDNSAKAPWSLGMAVLGSGIMALLLLIFLRGMNKASVSYAPGGYTSADVNFLFVSPINQRTVYAWSMLRAIGSSLYITLLVILYLPLISVVTGLHMDASRLVYTILAVIFVSLLSSALNFFIYSLSHRFGIGRAVKKTIRAITFAILAYLVFAALSADNALQAVLSAMNGPVFSNIPVIGWAKTLIMAPFVSSAVWLLPMLIALIAVTVLIIVLSVYYAVDYYEEATALAEWKAVVANGNTEAIREAVNKEAAKKQKKKAKNINLSWKAKGPWAFVWKQALANKRASRFVILSWDQIFLLAIGIFFGVASDNGFSDAAAFAVMYAIMYTSIMGTMPIGLNYELRKQYIYMLPGKPMYKILAVNMLTCVKAAVKGMAFVVPMWIILKLNVNQALSIWLFVTSADIMAVFSSIAVNIAMPSYDTKNVLQNYMRMGVQLLFMLPAMLLAVIGAIITNTVGGFYIFAASSTVEVFLLLAISGTLFKRLEMR